MGKAARVRAARRLAVLATKGETADVTKSVERRIRKEDHERRVAGPPTRRMLYLEHVARTQPAEHLGRS